jgi:hypothetical protein
MPVPVKPCEGAFSEETIKILLSNVDRSQWLLHACVRCGQQVGARLVNGRWVPDVHWPSVPRRPSSRPTKKVPDAKQEVQERPLARSGSGQVEST